MSDVDLAAVLGDQAKFEGEEVVAVALEIPTIAGGLQDAVQVEPFLMHGGDDAYVLMKVRCDKIRHDPFVDRNAGEKASERRGEGGPWRRVQILIPGTVAFVDETFAAGAIENMAAKVREFKAEQSGIHELPLDGGGDGGVGDD